MPARLYLDHPLHSGESLHLPSGPARHVQVLRLQPGDELTLFNGQGGEWRAHVLQMGRSDVQVQVDQQHVVDRELPVHVTLAVGMPANERMDALIEKATELGVAAVQPLLTERSVLRLSGERAEKRRAHWEGVAIAACEQSGRTRVPLVAPICTLNEWLQGLHGLQSGDAALRWLLSPGDAPVVRNVPRTGSLIALSGPEGGLSAAEEKAAQRAGFAPTSLGPRVLRADTAPLAVLAHIGMSLLG